MAMKHLANIEKSRKEYHALPDREWRKDYFDENTGGYLVTSWKRLEEAGKNHNEQQKFDMPNTQQRNKVLKSYYLNLMSGKMKSVMPFQN